MDLIGRSRARSRRVNATVFRQVNRAADWWDLPTPVALLNLRAHRDDLRSTTSTTPRPRARTAPRRRGTAALSHLRRLAPGPDRPEDGMVGSRFGRNAPTDATAPEPLPERLLPSPREVANRLLLRDEFKPGDQPQRARRLLDPVPESRLVRPRRKRARHLHRHRARRERRVAGGHADEAPGDQPRPHAHCDQRPAADLRQHRHPLVGPLAALRLDRGAQPRAARRRRRQAARSRTVCSRTRPTRSSTAST